MSLNAFAGIVAAVVLAACTATPAGPEEDAVSSTTSTTEVRLEAATAYTPLPGEPAPDVKQLASAVVQAIGTYDEGGDSAEAVAGRVAGLAVAPDVAAMAGPLLVRGASAIDIVYPQLGGLTDDAASVMLVVRHRTLIGEIEESLTRTIDVRLALGPTGWSVTGLASTGGGPSVPGAEVSPAARAVLENTGLDLPDTARWDIEAGYIDDRILNVLDLLGQERRISVTVLSTGHPTNVFGTDSLSNHTAGRGVDIWAVDGVPVIQQHDVNGSLHALVERLLNEATITELGAPWDLDGPGAGISFTNTVHQDHLHLAFDSP